MCPIHIAQQTGRALALFMEQALVGLVYQVNIICVGAVRGVLCLYLVLGVVSPCFGVAYCVVAHTIGRDVPG